VAANGRVSGAMLTDGCELPADILVAAAGIAPNADLAREAGLWVKRGVIVDERMRTSDGAILAAGDVAEHSRRVPGLWPVAVEQAEVAADNAVGGAKAYAGSVPFTMLKVVGVELASIGRFEAAEGDEEIVLEEEGGRYRTLVLENDRVVGAILLGYSREVAPVHTAISRGYDVGGVLDDLHAGRWDVLAGLSGERPLLAGAPAIAG
jgi:nitrite reductase (NADH) large subunit